MLTRLPLATLVALAAVLTPFAATPAHAQQPALTMEMALQSENLQGSPGASTTEDTMNVDWVEQFAWNS